MFMFVCACIYIKIIQRLVVMMYVRVYLCVRVYVCMYVCGRGNMMCLCMYMDISVFGSSKMTKSDKLTLTSIVTTQDLTDGV